MTCFCRDYRGLSADGYWSSAPDSRDAPLCAAADPAADYRWEARACGGPTVASFICELPGKYLKTLCNFQVLFYLKKITFDDLVEVVVLSIFIFEKFYLIYLYIINNHNLYK